MFACCDESGIHSGARWRVIGALWIPDDSTLPNFDASVTRLRQDTGCWGEFKWDKLGDLYLPAYQRLLDTALALPGVRLTCMAVDTKLFTPEAMKEYHPKGGPTEAYFKHARLLLSYRIRDLAAEGHHGFTLLYDRQPGSRDLRDRFRSQLLYDIGLIKTGAGRQCEFRHIAPVNSKVVPFVQATDLAIGAVWTAHEDAPDKSKQASARAAVRSQLATWAGQSLTQPTYPSATRFNLWHWKP
jgi:hypothetical protein